MLTERAPRSLPPFISPEETRRGAHLAVGWELYVMFGGLFVWWFLGFSGFIQAVLALPLLGALVMRTNVRMPKTFWLWVGFIAFMLASGIQVPDLQRGLAFGWRASIYIASTIIFLYVFNTSRQSLPARKLVNVLAGFWVLTVVGGLMGMAFPNHTFHSLMQALLPQKVLASGFVKDLVIPETTGGRTFTGTGIFRVKAPFIYTNQWGSAFALTLPFALGTLRTLRSRLWRLSMYGLLIVSIVPLVFSLDRGSWISTGVGTTYALIRLAGGHNRRLARTARGMIVGGLIVGAIVLISPLGSLVLLRSNSGYGDKHRLTLYSSSITLVQRSPILGYGAPVALSVLNPSAPPGPSIGTHGQFWTILVSNGIPAVVLFVAWFVVVFFKTGRQIDGEGGWDPDARFWSHVCVFTALIQMPYYELVPWGLPIAMVAAAVALREIGSPRFGYARMMARTRARVPARVRPR